MDDTMTALALFIAASVLIALAVAVRFWFINREYLRRERELDDLEQTFAPIAAPCPICGRQYPSPHVRTDRHT